MVGSGMFEGIATLLIIGMIAVFLCIAGLSYGIIDWLFIPDPIESSELLVPEIKLTIEGNKVDTIYIYKVK